MSGVSGGSENRIKLYCPSLFGRNQAVRSLCRGALPLLSWLSLPSSEVVRLGYGHCSLLEMSVKYKVFLRKWDFISEMVDIRALAPALSPIMFQVGFSVL